MRPAGSCVTIPEFRPLKAIVDYEVGNLEKLGLRFKLTF